MIQQSVIDQLYQDYSTFKKALFQDLVKQNPSYDALDLFKSAQKLLGRLMFMFFAQARGLLPAETIHQILIQGQDEQQTNAHQSIIHQFRKYFNYLNSGFESEACTFYPYNGDLFITDKILNQIKVSDDVLYKHTQQLSKYDYIKEVDVNILGYIFENSLNEIDAIKAELKGALENNPHSKRKKEGIFYTPQYITQYIVENTIGQLCQEKKTELGLTIEDYISEKNYTEKTIAKLDDKLTKYHQWLSALTICDPACGSGAFLNQALEFLINEHAQLADMRQNLYQNKEKMAASLAFDPNDILKNNLYGVDINKEAVEIAKLTLWLRIAKPNQKPNQQHHNIQVGNSLIDDSEVARDKAFNWQKAFPKVFKNGGFHVIIGNPPYVSFQSQTLPPNEIQYYKKHYTTVYKIYDLYALFIEKGIQLLKPNGLFSYICPSPMLLNDSFSKLRTYIAAQVSIQSFVMCADGVFADAVVPTTIFFFKKGAHPPQVTTYIANNHQIKKDQTFDYNFFTRNPAQGFNTTLSETEDQIICKAETNSIPLGEILEIREAIKTGNNPKFIKEVPFTENNHPVVTGKDISRYQIQSRRYLCYDTKLLSRPVNLAYFQQPKLFIRRVGSAIEAVLDDQNILATHVLYLGLKKNEHFELAYILALLNSTLFTKIYHLKYPPKGKVFPEIRIGNLRTLPVKNISIQEQQKFVQLSLQIQTNYLALQNIAAQFLQAIEEAFGIKNPNGKMQTWYQLNFTDFIKEIEKHRKKLKNSNPEATNPYQKITQAEQTKWEQAFKENTAKAKKIIYQIKTTDTKLDNEIFALYALTPKAIEILKHG